MTIVLLWMVAIIFLFLIVSEASWRFFLFVCNLIETQDRQVIKCNWKSNASELSGIYKEGQEMAA